MKTPAILLALGLLLGSASAQPAQKIEKTKVLGKAASVCTFDIRDVDLRLFWKDPNGTQFFYLDTLADALEAGNQRLVWGTNAGMYHGDFAPVGLFIQDGTTVKGINLENAKGNFFLKPNGVFWWNAQRAGVLESGAFAKRPPQANYATQSGPLLVQAGRIHPAFKKDSDSRLYRNGVGCQDEHTVIMMISDESVNLYEFSEMFRDGLKCPDALFLDGTVSALYCPELKRADRTMKFGVMMGIVERKK